MTEISAILLPLRTAQQWTAASPEKRFLALAQAASARGVELVAMRGGSMTSTTATMRCSRDHEFEVTRIRSWSRSLSPAACPVCLQTRLAALHAAAAARGGTCLTHELQGHSFARFRCSEGHEFEAAAYGILRGNWCKQCYIKEMHEASFSSLQAKWDDLATRLRNQGFSVLSYFPGTKTVRVLCPCSHLFIRPLPALARDLTCPVCSRQSALEDEPAEPAREVFSTALSDWCSNLPPGAGSLLDGHDQLSALRAISKRLGFADALLALADE